MIVMGDTSAKLFLGDTLLTGGDGGDNSLHGTVERIIVNAGAFAEDCICGIAEPIEEG